MLHVGTQHQHPDYNQRRRPDSRQVLFSTCFMLAPNTNTQTPTRGDDQTADKSCSPHASCWHPAPTPRLQPEETTRQQTSLVLHMLHVGTQHQTPRLQPEETTRQQTSLVLHMLHVGTKHPDSNQRRRRPDSRQVLFSTCFMLAPSTKHPDSNQRRRPDSRQVLFSTCFMLAPSTKHPDPDSLDEVGTVFQTF